MAINPLNLTAKQLKTELKSRSLPVGGTKPVLQARLTAALPPPPVNHYSFETRGLLPLIDDIVTIIATYTTPGPTMRLLTLGRSTSSFSYRDHLWKQKVIEIDRAWC